MQPAAAAQAFVGFRPSIARDMEGWVLGRRIGGYEQMHNRWWVQKKRGKYIVGGLKNKLKLPRRRDSRESHSYV